MMHFLQLSAALYAIVLIRYLIVAGLFYWAYWVRGKSSRKHFKISDQVPAPGLIRQEITASILSSSIFAVSGALLWLAWERGSTRIYTDVATYGWGYFILSIAILAFIHDTYFYFTHRWLHRSWPLKKIHYLHHRSKTPTPWAAFSFQFWEAMIEAIILPAFAFLLPVHPAALLTLMMIMTVLGVVNHLGYEIYPQWFATHPATRWLISATHHQMHHRRFNCNYGLYFTFWDRWLGTHHEEYEAIFKKAQLLSISMMVWIGTQWCSPLHAETPSPRQRIEREFVMVQNKAQSPERDAELARLLYYRGSLETDSRAKRDCFTRGFEAARRAQQASRPSAASLLWQAANLGGLARLESPFQALHSAEQMEQLLLQLKHLDARYEHSAADRILGHLYQTLPPLISIGSVRKARACFEAAVTRDGDYPANLAYYSNFEWEHGDCQSAKRAALRAQSSPLLHSNPYESEHWSEMIRHVLEMTERNC